MITWVATFLGPQGLPVAHKLDHVGHFSWVIMPVSSHHRTGVQCPAPGDSKWFSQHIPCVKTTLSCEAFKRNFKWAKMSFIRSFSQMPNMSKCTLYLRAWRMCCSDESGNSNEMSGLWFRVERMRQWVGLGRLQAGCRNKCRNNSYLARIDEDFWLCDEFPWFPSHLCPVSSEWWLGLMRLGQDPILSHWRLSLPATLPPVPSC